MQSERPACSVNALDFSHTAPVALQPDPEVIVRLGVEWVCVDGARAVLVRLVQFAQHRVDHAQIVERLRELGVGAQSQIVVVNRLVKVAAILVDHA